jgi:hypothetical protein
VVVVNGSANASNMHMPPMMFEMINSVLMLLSY